MALAACDMTLKMAREVLGVSSLSTPGEILGAYREAVKRAHPDGGGDQAAFMQVVEAYRRLQQPDQLDATAAADEALRAPREPTLEISPRQAMEGGETEHRLADGRSIRIALPPGLRSGDKVRAAGLELKIYVRALDGALVRGDDVWITVKVAPAVLRKGGRVSLDTPLGPHTVWIDRKAADRGLLRLEGQGLPARGRHPNGCLFLRLAPERTPSDSPALNLLRRFTAAWAA
jgi:curved DNA-binding protein